MSGTGCALCRREPAAGYASHGTDRYCHEGPSPTCYELASCPYCYAMGCPACDPNDAGWRMLAGIVVGTCRKQGVDPVGTLYWALEDPPDVTRSGVVFIPDQIIYSGDPRVTVEVRP